MGDRTYRFYTWARYIFGRVRGLELWLIMQCGLGLSAIELSLRTCFLLLFSRRR